MASEEANLKHLKELKPGDLERVREILLGVSAGYYKRLKCSSKAYVRKGEFEEFIKEASLETLATVLRCLAVLSQTKVYFLWRNPKIPR